MTAADSMLKLPAELSAGNCTALLAQYQSALAGADRLTLDGAALTQFDSSALALLLALRRRALQAGKLLVCQNLPENLRKLAHVYGVDGLIF